MATYTGTPGNDTLLGGPGDDIVDGLAGNDHLFGNEGNDSITGGADDDHLWGGLGNDTLDGGDGSDAVYYSDASAAVTVNLALGMASGSGSGTDTLISIENVFGSSFGDLLIGSAVVDNLYGQDGNDTMDGGPGNDNLYGGNGNDLLVGGAGSDYFQFRTTSADTSTDTLTDFQAGLGGDWLSIPTWLFSNYVSRANPFASGHTRLTQSSANTLVEIDVDGAVGPAGFETIAILSNVSMTSLLASNLGGFAPSDITPPTVTTFSPTDETVGVPISGNMVVSFSETIQRGIGNIVLKDASGAVIETFDAATSSRLSLSGAQLAVNPSVNLGYSTGYQVEFAAGTIQDLAGNSYAGSTSYNFTTTSALNESEVEKLYIAYFNRPGDVAGLAYWEGRLANGDSMTTIQNSFSSSAEYQAIYTGQQNTVLITQLYQNLFGRTVSVVDDGVLWWANEMTDSHTGPVKQTIQSIASVLSSGTTPGTADNIAINAKIEAATSFTDRLETPAERDGYVGAAPFAVASTWLAPVKDAATLTTAMTSLDATIAAAVSLVGVAAHGIAFIPN